MINCLSRSSSSSNGAPFPRSFYGSRISMVVKKRKKKKNFSLFQPFNFYFPQNVTLERFWAPRQCVYKNSISSHCSIVFWLRSKFYYFPTFPHPNNRAGFQSMDRKNLLTFLLTGKTCGTVSKSWHFQINFCVVLNKLHEKFKKKNKIKKT